MNPKNPKFGAGFRVLRVHPFGLDGGNFRSKNQNKFELKHVFQFKSRISLNPNVRGIQRPSCQAEEQQTRENWTGVNPKSGSKLRVLRVH